MRGFKGLLGISVFWLGLSMLFDGVNSIVLPNQLLKTVDESHKSTVLGLLTFVGITAGMLVQPVAGVFSDRMRPRWGRRGTIGLGVLLIVPSIAFFGLAGGIVALLLAYLAVQVSASIAQAAQQGFIPDLVPPDRRGLASGIKGFMDIGGAMIGFVLVGALLGSGREWLPLIAIAGMIVGTYVLTMLLVSEYSDRQQAAPDRVQLLSAFQLDFRQHSPFIWLVVSRFLFLLASYAINRFLLFFVADRLGLDPDAAAAEAGALLGALAFITVIAGPVGGWAADRYGRARLMVSGSLMSAAGAVLFILANSSLDILLFGSLLALGTGAFTAGNWAQTADLVPSGEAARFMGLANFGTAGGAAAAGLLGPLIDWANSVSSGTGYTVLFSISAGAFLGSALVLTRVGNLGARTESGPLPALDGATTSTPKVLRR